MSTAPHWMDEVEDAQERASYLNDDVPDWANIDLPDNSEFDSSLIGAQGILNHLVSHRGSYDFDEFNRQIGVVLSNEAEWIQQTHNDYELNGVTREDADREYDDSRLKLIEMVHNLQDKKVHIPVEGYKALNSINDDKFISENMQGFGREYSAAVVSEISYGRVSSGNVPVPDNLGIDFSKSMTMTPEVAREITREHDAKSKQARQERIRQLAGAELDGVTGRVDESAYADVARINVNDGLSKSEAERDLEGDERYDWTPERIDEFLDDMDAASSRGNNGRRHDGPDF